MGQTLSHGVYLPNEGERNCYAGLASNWRILNTAVGAIAEKAPLVHTHGNITNDGKVGTDANKPLITGTGGAVQAGSFGNQANTFCEGNDSRLSDARTPLSHTHTKSDVTDLLNSNFIPSANNSYDLGSSSYQWNNVYAKEYYYNGVAWGLDKANTWTADQFIGKSAPLFNLKNTSVETTVYPSSGQKDTRINFQDKNGHNLGSVLHRVQNNRSILYLRVFDFNRTDSENAWSDIAIGYANNGVAFTAAPTPATADNSTKIATTAFVKAQGYLALNGVNPGALSLPNVRAAVADPIDTNGWNLSGSRNKYTPTEDGWFYIRVAGTGSCAINIHNGDTDNSYPTWFNTSTGGYAALVVPVEKGITLYVYITATSIEYCSFRPCIGNV